VVAVGFTAFAVARGDRRILAYLAVTGIGALAVAVAHRRKPIRPVDAWALTLCGVLHLVGGLLPGRPVFYETWVVEHVVKYDQFVHFTITATVTAVLARRPGGTEAKAVALALGAGLANEVFEALSSLRFADAYVGGFTNASWDLVFNAFGAVTAATVLRMARVQNGADRPGLHAPGQRGPVR
jgi:hypothetical protein